MGALCCCYPASNAENDASQPDLETRQRQQAEAAERRLKEQESKGVKDPEGAKRRQMQREAAEREAEKRSSSGGGGLRWQVN